jgi:hypothetical protein
MAIAKLNGRPRPLKPRKGISLMEIRFISSLTADDEASFAPAVLKALSAFLDQLPIAYTVRIETSGAQVFQHTHVRPENGEDAVAASVNVTKRPFPFGTRGPTS